MCLRASYDTRNSLALFWHPASVFYRNHEDWRAPPRDSDSDPQIMETEFWCGPTRPNRILLVHGLEIFPINCDSVFNLFCLYGNITSVKVLRNGKVLVEMNDVESAKRCVNNLHHLPLDGCHKMKVKWVVIDEMLFLHIYSRIMECPY